jgi:xanthine dehydrogenase YagS FAD-binding subunit
MKAFEWVSAASISEAVNQLRTQQPVDNRDEAPHPIAGGQDLLTAMKDYIVRPSRVVNLKSIPGLDRIQVDSKGLSIGALATLTQLELHPEVRRQFPGLAQAASEVATPQIRNLGTVGGNLCQRPRCWYFRLESVVCLRKGGDECYAESGENKYNAILGGGPSFIVHPSDLAPMLVALGASVTTASAQGGRTVLLEKFFVLPSEEPTRENVLEQGEIITEIRVPASPFAARSIYLKFKERDSLDFALSAVAAALEMDSSGSVRQARLVLGGVAPVPWRVPKAEEFLAGKRLDPATLAEASRLALRGAAPLSKNAYKVPLTQTLIRRALAKAGEAKPG